MLRKLFFCHTPHHSSQFRTICRGVSDMAISRELLAKAEDITDQVIIN